MDKIVRRLVGQLRINHVIPLAPHPERQVAAVAQALAHAFEVPALDRLEERLQPGGSVPAEPRVIERLVAPRDTVPMKDMTRALDEIYMLRTLLACEAVRVDESMKLRNNQRSAVRLAELANSRDRMRMGARGECPKSDFDHEARVDAREKAGASEFLNYPNWRDEREAS
ncbi:MAG: hypothetical protein WC054_01385 [Candidatus Nanopelagicales bacterium]